MTKKLHFIPLLALPILLSGCELFSKVTERQVSFDDYKEAVFKVDTNHNYTNVKVTGYTNTVMELNESYDYNAVTQTWSVGLNHETTLAYEYIIDVINDAKQLDIKVNKSTITNYYKFYIGISNSYHYTCLTESSTLQLNFDDKYGMITKYYFKNNSKTLSFEFTYSN